MKEIYRTMKNILVSNFFLILLWLTAVILAVTFIFLMINQSEIKRLKAENEFFKSVTNSNSCYWTGN